MTTKRWLVLIGAVMAVAWSAPPHHVAAQSPQASPSEPGSVRKKDRRDTDAPAAPGKGHKRRDANSAAPSCEIGAAPEVILHDRGRPLRLSWSTQNATSATLDQILGAVPLSGQKTADLPKRTTTYTMSVHGPEGSASCRVSVAVPERTEPLHWPPAPLAGLPADYLARARKSLGDAITKPKLVNDERWIMYAITSLLFEQDVAAVNAYFAEQWTFPAHPEFGFGLFGMDAIRLYGLFNARSGTFPGRLSEAAQRHIEEEFFKIAAQTRYNTYEFADPVHAWTLRGSDNHTFAAQTSSFLASQFLKNSPSFAGRRYEDGRTPAQNYEAWHRHFSALLEERAKRGLFVEVGSPSYEDEVRQAFQNMRDFAEDPVIRKKAEMLLDIAYALSAEDSLNGVRGGAKSRVYTFRPVFWGGATDRAYNLIFAPPGTVPRNVSEQATSSYFPPLAVLGIGKDQVARGSYEIVQRAPGVGPPGRLEKTVDRERSVYRYGFVTPTYVLGSFVLDPGESYVAPSGQNRWQGVIFGDDPEARIAPQVTRLKGREVDSDQSVFNGFASLQDRNVLITQRSNYQADFQSRTDVYFASALDALDEEDGWIFVREKNSFAALRPVSPGKGYAWLDPATRNKNRDPRRNFITLSDADAPIIVVANQAVDYGGDFARFKAAIKAQPIRREGGVLSFATLAFYGPKKIGSRNGVAVDVAPRRLYNSPFIRSEFGSGIVYIRRGEDTLKLDYSNPEKPIKTVGAPLTADFPSGVGQAKPIVFSAN